MICLATEYCRHPPLLTALLNQVVLFKGWDVKEMPFSFVTLLKETLSVLLCHS